MVVPIHSDDFDMFKDALSGKTPALNIFFAEGRTQNVSRVIQELRFIGRTGAKVPAEFARVLVPSLLKATTLELEVGE